MSRRAARWRRSAVAALALLGGTAAACPGLQVRDAWIADAPPGAAVRVGYAVLENDGAAPLTIDRVDSADFASVGPHRMSQVGGVLQMRPLPRLEVPAHGRTVLQAGGDHLMLEQPRRPLPPGAHSELLFHCGAQATAAAFAVRGPAP